MAQNLPRGTPARVLVLLALLMGLSTVSVWRDALKRDAATWVRHPTALGDTGLFLASQPAVRLNAGGKAMTLTAGSAPFHRQDDRMFRVTTGFGENLPFSVFSTRETLETEAEPKLYARTAPHQFRRLRVTLDTPVSSSDGAQIPALALPLPQLETPIRKAILLSPAEQDSLDKSPLNETL